ncbi:hypothetical protein NL108_013508 [Boleophthalmus pectinirostris]|uniref:uncharacterized protein C1orf131 homolog n=1 Tax=Boleophthalmus pectinirostris TaxID=150288 RepID=UPI000A1C2729|nr:uncharacterized protein C1orf131 homolog [Boleophthalmus pectinirostris]XP_055005362.1 uncharacterized protein C1orf131 homolog [Boleophthalmus pectinirostris]KAJ0061226.1 hypothetical protein NL108_013508 [Boleophthalmus pectinirostris]
MNTKANGKSDEDCLFLEQVLDKLYDFGTKKKKKRKRRADVKEFPESKDDDSVTSTTQHQSEQTAVAQKDHQVEVVTFQDPRKKIKTKHTSSPDKIKLPQTKDKNSEQTEELSLEKARLEVHRFGITGYKKEQQRVFEQDRAIMLGARPPKKQYVNYKQLQQQIKEKKQKEKEEVDPELKTKKKKKNNPKDKKKQSTSGSGSGPSGQVGRFKNGMLILSTKEIQKIKGTKGQR